MADETEIFSIVREAQQAAAQLVKERMKEKRPLMGWEVDQAAREVLQRAGDHGPGTHMDNYKF